MYLNCRMARFRRAATVSHGDNLTKMYVMDGRPLRRIGPVNPVFLMHKDLISGRRRAILLAVNQIEMGFG